jgi:hypothetical protein
VACSQPGVASSQQSSSAASRTGCFQSSIVCMENKLEDWVLGAVERLAGGTGGGSAGLAGASSHDIATPNERTSWVHGQRRRWRRG